MLTALLLMAASDVPVPDAELATMRGGFALPGGLAVTIAVQTDTRLDGALLLRSVYRVDQGAPTLNVIALPSESGTQPGALQVTQLANGQTVKLAGDRIEVSHLVGGAVGAIVVNSGNDRVIDTASTLGLTISGATAANLGSSMLRVDRLAGDATAAMLPR